MTCFFIIAHAPLASALRAAALHVFPEDADAIGAYDVQPNERPQQAVLAAQAQLQALQSVLPKASASPYSTASAMTATTATTSTLTPATPTRSAQSVLLLTDLFGATPCNIAAQLADGLRSKLVAGVNLPMLLRAISYRHESLDSVLSRAVTGGIQGVMAVAVTPQQHQRMKAYDQSQHHHQQ